MKTTSKLVSIVVALLFAALALPSSAAAAPDSGYMIRTDLNDKCMDVDGNDTSNGARVQIYSCHGHANQRWTWYDDGTIRSDLNGKCLDIKNRDDDDHARVQMYSCHGNANQRWYWYGDGTIRSDLNGKCLDVKGADGSNGTRVQMYSCHGNANQRWYGQW